MSPLIVDHHAKSGLSWLGAKSLYEGRLTEAESYLDEAITLQEAIGKAFGYVSLKALKAALTFWRGEIEQSVRLVQAGLDFAQDQNPFGSRSLSLAILSFAVTLGGESARGRALCEEARASYRADVSIWIDWGMALATCALEDNHSPARSLRVIAHEALHDLKSTTFQWLCLPIAAILSARAGQPERAVELLGLADAAPKALTGWMDRWPLLSEVRRHVRAQLAEETFMAAWERCRAMSLDAVFRAIREPTSADDSAVPQVVVTPARGTNRALAEPLSVREVEVLRLIADGLSNAEIGAKLVISVATVKVHARTIYGKLGVRSRTQAIAQAHNLRLL